MMVAVLLNAFAKTEEDFLRLSTEAREFSGACANVMLVYRDTIYVANLGDCRAVMGRLKGKTVSLSRDHKASVEKNRIRKVGGFVKNGRVNGILAISRTIGDREFKDPIPLTGTSPSNTGPTLTGRSPSGASTNTFSNRPGQNQKSNGSGTSTPVIQPSPSLRRVASPGNILLKNVRDTAESPTRTRHRSLNSSSGSITRSTGSIEESTTKGSTSREPSPIPFTASEAPGSGRVSRRSGSSNAAPAASKPKKRRSSGVKVSNGSITESDSSAEQSSLSVSDSSIPRSAASKPVPAESLPTLIESIKDAKDDDDDVARSNGSEEEDLSHSGNLTSSQTINGDSDIVEGMFHVIECYDAESKQRKFGFKKKRPPKDPKYETGTLVSAIPEITIMRRTSEDDWIFLASDGFYDLFTSKQAGVAVSKHLQRNGRDRLSETVRSLCEEASLLGSEDDITGILIMLKAQAQAQASPASSTPSSTPSSAPTSPNLGKDKPNDVKGSKDGDKSSDKSN